MLWVEAKTALAATEGVHGNTLFVMQKSLGFRETAFWNSRDSAQGPEIIFWGMTFFFKGHSSLSISSESSDFYLSNEYVRPPELPHVCLLLIPIFWAVFHGSWNLSPLVYFRNLQEINVEGMGWKGKMTQGQKWIWRSVLVSTLTSLVPSSGQSLTCWDASSNYIPMRCQQRHSWAHKTSHQEEFALC